MKKFLFIALVLLSSCCRDENVYKIDNKTYEAPRVVVLSSKYDSYEIQVPEKFIISGLNYKGVRRIRFVNREVYDSIQLGDTIHVYPLKGSGSQF